MEVSWLVSQRTCFIQLTIAWQLCQWISSQALQPDWIGSCMCPAAAVQHTFGLYAVAISLSRVLLSHTVSHLQWYKNWYCWNVRVRLSSMDLRSRAQHFNSIAWWFWNSQRGSVDQHPNLDREGEDVNFFVSKVFRYKKINLDKFRYASECFV